MGILDFLRRKEPEKIKFDQLGPWLDKQVAEKKLEQKIALAKQEMNILLSDTRTLLDELEAAKLANENIPVQQKQVMEGHRKAYIQKIKRFLDEIDVPDDFSQIGHYNARFSEKVGQLGADTVKNFAVLTQFFGQESGKIAQRIKSLEDSIVRLNSGIEKEGVELIKEAKIHLKQYNDDFNKREMLKSALERHTQELDGLKNKKDKIQQRLNELKTSNEYNTFKEFIDEKNKVEEEISQNEQELITLFSELNRPLKKFTHKTANESLADKYIADPAGSLLEDESLRIVDLLKQMIQDLSILELKDKQLEKAQAMAEKLSRDFLHQKRAAMLELKDRNRDLATRINRSVAALNISENEGWMRSIERKLGEWEALVAKTAKEIEELNLDYLKQKAKEKARQVKKDLEILEDSV